MCFHGPGARGCDFVTGYDGRIAELLGEMTVAEKAELVTGDGIWTTRAVELSLIHI